MFLATPVASSHFLSQSTMQVAVLVVIFPCFELGLVDARPLLITSPHVVEDLCGNIANHHQDDEKCDECAVRQ